MHISTVAWIWLAVMDILAPGEWNIKFTVAVLLFVLAVAGVVS